MSRSLSIVIPVYNSSLTLENLVEEIQDVIHQHELVAEIILVDDNSHDDSWQQILRLAKENKDIFGISLEENFGQQNAILCGLRYAKGEYVITMDDDLQHNPQDIISLMEELDKGFDVVYGIPEIKRHGRLRNLGTRLNDKLFGWILGKPSHIRVSSYRVMSSAHKEQIIQSRKSFVYLSAITLGKTKNIGNISVHHRRRKIGTSNYNYQKLFLLFMKLAIVYSPLGESKIFSRKPQYHIREVTSR